MAEVFAPFIINRTMHNLTFYCMEGRNFVRTKSSLTRKRVLHSPEFERTRYHAGLMAKASKIGSFVYNSLPEYWRQGWMYRSFTGEALTLLKARKKEDEIQQILLQQYVVFVVNKRPAKEAIAALPVQSKRTYRKLDTIYWKSKTIKSRRRKAHKQKLLHNAALLARASKIGSVLYAQLPSGSKSRCFFQYLTGLAMKLLKEQISEHDILTELGLALQSADQSIEGNAPEENNSTHIKKVGLVSHPKGQYRFINSSAKRFSTADHLKGRLPSLNFHLKNRIFNTIPLTLTSSQYLTVFPLT